VERSGANLTGALAAVEGWEGFAHRVGSDRVVARLTLLDMLCVARLLCRAALLREESRGTHHRRDFPERDDATWRAHLVQRRGRDPVRVRVPATARDPDVLVPARSGA
jgi:L-aspartate oxidase